MKHLVCALCLLAPIYAAEAGSGREPRQPPGGSGTAGRSDRSHVRHVFDHSQFDSLLREHVRAGGEVNYSGMARERSKLDRYAQRLATADLTRLDRAERMALWINAYNAFTLLAVLERYPRLGSIREIPRVWSRRIYSVAATRYSIGQIENDILRRRFGDPHIHFAIHCASRGCPILRAAAYTGARLDAQLDEAARTFINSGRGVRLSTRASGR